MKILIEQSNSSPSNQDLVDYMNEETRLGTCFEPANAKRDFWQNNYATLVLRLKEGATADFSDGFALANLAWKYQADEFDKMREDDVTYYRIWWD